VLLPQAVRVFLVQLRRQFRPRLTWPQVLLQSHLPLPAVVARARVAHLLVAHRRLLVRAFPVRFHHQFRPRQIWRQVLLRSRPLHRVVAVQAPAARHLAAHRLQAALVYRRRFRHRYPPPQAWLRFLLQSHRAVIRLRVAAAQAQAVHHLVAYLPHLVRAYLARSHHRNLLRRA